MNYWFWLYIIVVPVIVLAATPQMPEWWRAGRLLAAILICYLLINLAVDLKWEFIRAEVNAMPNPTDADLTWATADGGNLVFARVFGWVSAATYAGWWELVWRLTYRKNISNRKINMRFSSRIIGFSLIVSFLVALLSSLPPRYPYSIMNFLHITLPPSIDMIYR